MDPSPAPKTPLTPPAEPKPVLWFRFHQDDVSPFALVVYFQVLVAAGIFLLAGFARGWLGVLFAAVAYLMVAIGMDVETWKRIRREEAFARGDIWMKRRIRWMSFFGILLVGMLAAYLAYRTRWAEEWLAGALTLIVVLAAAVLIGLIAARPLRSQRVPWLLTGGMMVLFPACWAWVASSNAVHEMTMSESWARSWRTVEREAPAAVVAERANLARCPDGARWLLGGEPLPVAVALSGGGYRAAVTHAGLLAALDARCVPIRYLSTVSGGSIVGGYYALGHRPRDFAALLWREKPGLPYEKLHYFTVLGTWFNPWRSDADDYARHFGRVFFGSATLADLPERPVLLVNATDLEAPRQHAREVFFRERGRRLALRGGQTLDRATKVADVVAASGAFPGAFEPKRIVWAAAEPGPAAPQPIPRKFIDGGVVENLGVEGLRRYLTLDGAGAAPAERPRVLIVSDASMRGEAEAYPRRVGLLEMLDRAQGISYDALHEHLLGRYTERTDFWAWTEREPIASQVSAAPYHRIDERLAAGEPDRLWVVVVPVTGTQIGRQLARYSGCRLGGRAVADVQREVARYPTLKELGPGQVEAAYWLGHALGTIYAPAIECARARAADPQAACPGGHGVAVGASDPARLACPSFDDLVPESVRSR